MRLHGVGCLAAAWLLSLAQAEGDPPSSQGKLPDSASAFKLQPGDVDMYPYAYHEATDFNTAACGGKVPVIFSLNGIDSFRHGDEEVLNKIGQTALGRIIAGSAPDLPVERSKILNEQVYTVFPSAKFNEADQHYHPKQLDLVRDHVLKKFGDKIDKNRIYVIGYSAGCRGAIRWAIESKPTAIICVAGGAEKEAAKRGKEGDGLYYGWRVTQNMGPTFPRLSALKEVPLYLLQGSADKTAKGKNDMPMEAPDATYQELNQKLGSKVVKFRVLDGLDHGAMRWHPYTTTGDSAFGWLMQHGQCSSSRRFGRW